jgi:rhamnosyltransferase
VSVVVLTKDGGPTLVAAVEAVKAQDFHGGFELVLVDSGTTDGSLAAARRVADRVLHVQPSAFNHGGTRNFAVEHARGEFVVMLVQDAVPASPRWLTALIEPFDDPRVAGTFARQEPRPDASAIARHYLANWVAASPRRRVMEIADAQAFDSMSPRERLNACAFDNVCACIRRSVWTAHPFRPTPIAEDLAWGREVLLAGHRVAYAPDAVVVHSHDRSLAYELARTRDLHDRLNDLFGVHTIPTATALAGAIASSALLHARLEWSRPHRWPTALGLAVVWPLGQFLGARSARARRRESSRVPACAS